MKKKNTKDQKKKTEDKKKTKRKVATKEKEREFARKLVKNNGNKTKTAKEVYGISSDDYAYTKARRLVGKERIQQLVKEEEENLKQALIKQGITPEKIAERIGTLLHATDKEGNQEYSAIDKGLKHAKEIYGIEDSDNKKTSNVYQFFHNPTFQQNLQKYDQNFKEQLLNHEHNKTIETTAKDVETNE